MNNLRGANFPQVLSHSITHMEFLGADLETLVKDVVMSLQNLIEWLAYATIDLTISSKVRFIFM